MTKRVTIKHDEVFKKTVKKIKNARDFIEYTFPVDVKQRLDLNTLRLDNTSYISDNLNDYYSDLVFSCTYKNKEPLKIAILIEHKAQRPKYPYHQLMNYIWHINDFNITERKDIIPVIPVLFYHGADKWIKKPATEYYNDIDEPLKKFVPSFDYILIDLAAYKDEAIINYLFKSLEIKILFLIMKHIFDRINFEKNLDKYLEIGKIYYESEEGLNFLKIVVEYVIYVPNLENKEEIINIVKKVSEKGGEFAMTLATQFKLEGKQEKAIEDAQKMLEEGLATDLIQRVTGLTKKEIENLKKK